MRTEAFVVAGAPLRLMKLEVCLCLDLTLLVVVYTFHAHERQNLSKVPSLPIRLAKHSSHETGVEPSLAGTEDYISIRLPHDQCLQRERKCHSSGYGRVPSSFQIALSLRLTPRFCCDA